MTLPTSVQWENWVSVIFLFSYINLHLNTVQPTRIEVSKISDNISKAKYLSI